MRLHKLELIDPVPTLNDADALAIVRPWIDTGNVGSLLLSGLVTFLKAKELAKLSQPGSFFDFTRYRPMVNFNQNGSDVTLPTTVMHYGRLPDGRDLIMMNLLEPHNMAEEYVENMVEFLKYFGVKRYFLFGSVYDMVPYTRPLLLTGNASSTGLKSELAVAGVTANEYSGPTSVLSLIGEMARSAGLETCSVIVHLLNYLTMDNDYVGKRRLMEVISSLYKIPLSEDDISKANEQEERIRQLSEQFLQQNPHVRVILQQLEENYDARTNNEKQTHLSPEVEKFLQDMNNRFMQE